MPPPPQQTRYAALERRLASGLIEQLRRSWRGGSLALLALHNPQARNRAQTQRHIPLTAATINQMTTHSSWLMRMLLVWSRTTSRSSCSTA